jgi:type IV pilus assembly protein PilE
MPDRNGFTLIEIIVVVVIMAILAIIAIPNYSTMMMQSAARAAQNNLINIYNAQKTYYVNNNSYCIAGCDTAADIGLAANLNLNINDTNFAYACNNTSGFTCIATNQTNNNFKLTVSNKSIVTLGGAGCATTAGANCNPSCAPTNSVYCPSS